MRPISRWKLPVLCFVLLVGQTTLALHEADIAQHDAGEVCQVCLLGSAGAGAAGSQPALSLPDLAEEPARATALSIVVSERFRVSSPRGPPA
jgi:hypothetical protein